MLYIFCEVCSDILTRLICILIFFFKRSKSQKIRSIRIIEILLPLTNNNSNRHQTRHTPSNFTTLSLSSFSPFHLVLTSLHSLHWLDCVTQEVRSSTSEYTYGWDLQKTTCILSRRVSVYNRPWQLTSYSAIFHLSTDCNPSLLRCGDCLINCYWYLICIKSLHNLTNSILSVHITSPP